MQSIITLFVRVHAIAEDGILFLGLIGLGLLESKVLGSRDFICQ